MTALLIEDDPLPSWRDGRVKAHILDFVAAVTTRGSSEFRMPDERVAVFDHDGTLWCEQPIPVQAYFARDQVATIAAAAPALRDRQPFKAFLDHDVQAIHALGRRELFEFLLSINAGLTVEAHARRVRAWLASTRHPVLTRPYAEAVYQPQLELLRFLRTHSFKTFIVSAGGIYFIRAFAELLYGVTAEQVIGSAVKTRFETHDGHSELVSLADLLSFNDREAKVRNIGLHIGRRPLLAFGNSDGDMAMMHYTRSGRGRRLALLLHHDDSEREYAYDREFRVSPLIEALNRRDELHFELVSMQRDWRTIFPAPRD
jgi:phosphoserine phosphatase